MYIQLVLVGQYVYQTKTSFSWYPGNAKIKWGDVTGRAAIDTRADISSLIYGPKVGLIWRNEPPVTYVI
jgi:hypothetical protein